MKKWAQTNNTYHGMPIVTSGNGLDRLIKVLRVGRLKGCNGKDFRKRLLWT